MLSSVSCDRAARRRAWTLALMLVAAVACNSGGPTDPDPVDNTPPVIQSLVADVTRIEAGEEVQLTAVVQDAETSLSQLAYTWSASPSAGTIIGSGAQVRWRAPKPATTPDTYTLTLKVTETYVSSGAQRTNEVTKDVQVRYNDSVPEIMAITSLFLNEFMNDAVSADQCVRNFSDSCATAPEGKNAERMQVQANRDLFNSISATVSFSQVVLNGARTSADIDAPCTFRSIRKSTGVLEVAQGTCVLTAVYESFRWWLCTSRFFQNPSSSSTALSRMLSAR